MKSTSRSERAVRIAATSPFRSSAGPAAARLGLGGDRAELFLQLEHDALRGLLADPGNRLEARGVLERDCPAQVGSGRAGHDRQRDLRADSGDGQQVLEELALGRLAE